MRKLTNWIESYLEYSKYSEAPEKFHFWTAISVLAGALRRRVWIDQLYFQWTPNFYIVFVAPPGIVSKTTTMNIGMKLLREVPDIVFGPDAVTWQALVESLSRAGREEPDPSTGLLHSMSCITIASGEFGTFLDPSNREMVDVMVSLWDGQLGPWEKATKTQGSDMIVNPWINMIACTTPMWIAQNFPEYMIGGGFTSRCVFVYAEEKRHLVAYPRRHASKELSALRMDLIHDLEVISRMFGEYELSPAAERLGESWYEQHYSESLQISFDESRAAGYRARKQTFVHKLAMVLAAARSDELVIQEEDLIQSVELMNTLEREMHKVFQYIGRSEQVRYADAVRGVVRRHGVIDKAALYRELMSMYSAKEVDEGIHSLQAAGVIRLASVAGRILLEYTEVSAHGEGSADQSSAKAR